jgi:hypothetical protein
MANRHDLVVFTIRGSQVFPQLIRQINPLVVLIVFTARVRVIEQELLPVYQIHPATVGVTERVKC